MKKFLQFKFICWTIFIIFVLWVQINALFAHLIMFDGLWYLPFMSENWWIFDILFAIPITFSVFYYKSTAFRNWADKILSYIPLMKIKTFLSFTKFNLYLTLALIGGSFCLGWLIAIIRSSEYEDYLAMFFYLLAPEVAIVQVFSADWADTLFVLSTVGILLAKWTVFYLLAATWSHFRPTHSDGAMP